MNLRVFLLFAAYIVSATALRVPLTIYYESLCPDSAHFINEQVYPALKTELKDYAEIMWIPFGKSRFSTLGADVLFDCHHGPNECYGNKVHACAIEHIQASSYQTEFTRESLILDFINCMMKVGKNFPDSVYPGAKCAHESHISIWENIQQCANTTEGSQLLKKHGETTNRFQDPLVSVPTVVFKQKYDSNENKRALSDFKSSLCSYIPEPKPRVCSNTNNSYSINHGSNWLMGILIPIVLKFIHGNWDLM